MKIGVEEIRRSLKPHFIWSKEPIGILDVDEDFYSSGGIAAVIFIGLATMYGVSPEEIKEFLGIEHQEYKGKLSKFYYYVREGMDLDEVGKLNYESVEGRHYNKYRLCMNYINLNFRQTEIVPIENIFKI